MLQDDRKQINDKVTPLKQLRHSFRKIVLTDGDSGDKESPKTRRFSDSAALAPVVVNRKVLPPVQRQRRASVSADANIQRHVQLGREKTLLNRRSFRLGKEKELPHKVECINESSNVLSFRRKANFDRLSNSMDGAPLMQNGRHSGASVPTISDSCSRSRSMPFTQLSRKQTNGGDSQNDFFPRRKIGFCVPRKSEDTEEKVEKCLREIFPNYYPRNAKKLHKTPSQTDFSVDSKTVLPLPSKVQEKAASLHRRASFEVIDMSAKSLVRRPSFDRNIKASSIDINGLNINLRKQAFLDENNNNYEVELTDTQRQEGLGPSASSTSRKVQRADEEATDTRAPGDNTQIERSTHCMHPKMRLGTPRMERKAGERNRDSSALINQDVASDIRGLGDNVQREQSTPSIHPKTGHATPRLKRKTLLETILSDGLKTENPNLEEKGLESSLSDDVDVEGYSLDDKYKIIMTSVKMTGIMKRGAKKAPRKKNVTFSKKVKKIYIFCKTI